MCTYLPQACVTKSSQLCLLGVDPCPWISKGRNSNAKRMPAFWYRQKTVRCSLDGKIALSRHPSALYC